MRIIDGKSIASRRLEILRNKIQETKLRPKLAIVMVGEDLASRVYVNLKIKRAAEVGIETEIIERPEETGIEELVGIIRELNGDKSVTGILVQLPLPKGLDADLVLDKIDPEKDVDGLTGKGIFLPAAVKGILTIYDEIASSPDGHRDPRNDTWCIVGHGRLVGKPLGEFLKSKSYKVLKCDINTSHLSLVTRQGDVLVVATGKEKLITADMVKPGAMLIDCGSPKAEVDFENVCKVADWITPVPGGVGPVTVVSLLENTLEAAHGVNHEL